MASEFYGNLQDEISKGKLSSLICNGWRQSNCCSYEGKVVFNLYSVQGECLPNTLIHLPVYFIMYRYILESSIVFSIYMGLMLLRYYLYIGVLLIFLVTFFSFVSPHSSRDIIIPTR